MDKIFSQILLDALVSLYKSKKFLGKKEYTNLGTQEK